jgi:hypothetical protein
MGRTPLDCYSGMRAPAGYVGELPSAILVTFHSPHTCTTDHSATRVLESHNYRFAESGSASDLGISIVGFGDVYAEFLDGIQSWHTHTSMWKTLTAKSRTE